MRHSSLSVLSHCSCCSMRHSSLSVLSHCSSCSVLQWVTFSIVHEVLYSVVHSSWSSSAQTCSLVVVHWGDTTSCHSRRQDCFWVGEYPDQAGSAIKARNINLIVIKYLRSSLKKCYQ